MDLYNFLFFEFFENYSFKFFLNRIEMENFKFSVSAFKTVGDRKQVDEPFLKHVTELFIYSKHHDTRLLRGIM